MKTNPTAPNYKGFRFPSEIIHHEDETPEGRHPPEAIKHRRLGLKHPKFGIPAEHWPTVVQRVMEQKELLRTVAAIYGVSHETTRRIMHHVQ